jgi:hypothetical protein
MKALGGKKVKLLLVRKLGTRWVWVVRLTPRPRFSPGERTPDTHWTGSWVCTRAGLDTEARGNILFTLLGIETRSSGRPLSRLCIGCCDDVRLTSQNCGLGPIVLSPADSDGPLSSHILYWLSYLSSPLRHQSINFSYNQWNKSPIWFPMSITGYLIPWRRVLLEYVILHSASQEIPQLLRNRKVYYSVHNSPPPVPILSQISSIHSRKPKFFTIHFNIILPITPRSSEWSLPPPKKWVVDAK